MRHSNASDFVKCAACRAVYDWDAYHRTIDDSIDQSTTVAPTTIATGGPHERRHPKAHVDGDSRVLVMIGAAVVTRNLLVAAAWLLPVTASFILALGRSCHSRMPTPSGPPTPPRGTGVAVRPCRASTASARTT